MGHGWVRQGVVPQGQGNRYPRSEVYLNLIVTFKIDLCIHYYIRNYQSTQSTKAPLKLSTYFYFYYVSQSESHGSSSFGRAAVIITLVFSTTIVTRLSCKDYGVLMSLSPLVITLTIGKSVALLCIILRWLAREGLLLSPFLQYGQRKGRVLECTFMCLFNFQVSLQSLLQTSHIFIGEIL